MFQHKSILRDPTIQRFSLAECFGRETSSGIWVDQAILTSISDVESGTYNFTLIVSDTSDNQASDTVIVTVKEPSELIVELSDDVLLLIGGAVLGGLILIWLLVRRRRAK